MIYVGQNLVFLPTGEKSKSIWFSIHKTIHKMQAEDI